MRPVGLDFGGLELIAGDICCPEWSPSRDRIAVSIGGDDDTFAFGRTGDDVAVGRVHRADWRSVAAGRDASWSPDGKRIVFSSDRSGDWELYTVSAVGGKARRITRLDGYDGSPDWSPDGQMIVFEHESRDGTVALLVMPANGGSPQVVATADGIAALPSWQPIP
jgi:Tol biopolymer transport system component